MGSKEGAAKARDIALSKNPDHFKIMGSLGGKVSHPESRPFYLNRGLARKAGEKGGRISRRGKVTK